MIDINLDMGNVIADTFSMYGRVGKYKWNGEDHNFIYVNVEEKEIFYSKEVIPIGVTTTIKFSEGIKDQEIFIIQKMSTNNLFEYNYKKTNVEGL